jgi:hypothetical protein
MTNKIDKVQALFFHDGEPSLIGIFEGDCINETIYAAAVNFVNDSDVGLHKRNNNEMLDVYRVSTKEWLHKLYFYIEEHHIQYRIGEE